MQIFVVWHFDAESEYSGIVGGGGGGGLNEKLNKTKWQNIPAPPPPPF